jgi:hypothetical protein
MERALHISDSLKDFLSIPEQKLWKQALFFRRPRADTPTLKSGVSVVTDQILPTDTPNYPD